MLLEIFDSIFTNKTSATKIKSAIAKIQNKEIISKDKKENEPIEDITNQYENSDHDY